LRHGRVWDRTAWTKVHREWLSAQAFEQVNTELAFIDNLAACEGLIARREALDERLSWVALDPEFWPIVRRLRAFRGLDTLSALVIVLEVADFTRFPRAVQLGSWLGLVPSREQSGESDRHGSITKTASKYARRILVEAAWHYARPPRIGRTLYERQEGAARPHRADSLTRPAPPLPDPPSDARAQKPGNVIMVACARELDCFLWAAAIAP
jgi:transposase